MRNTVKLIVFLLWCICGTANAQHDWERLMCTLGEPEDMAEGAWESVYDVLCELEANPVDINAATREELEQLPFLTARDVEGICEYVYRYGGMKTLGELAMIEGLDYDKQQLLRCFVYIGERKERNGFPAVRDILEYGRQEVLLTGKIPFYEREGDRNGYLGYKYKHNVRYSFRYGDRVRLGFVGAQDAGEPFFANRNRAGYDFYSFYLYIKGLGRIKSLVLGRYRADFGMGLVMNTDFVPGKTAMLASLGRSSGCIRPHSSTVSSSYLQGAAATVDIARNVCASAFVSYRGLDATLNKDSTIATILTSGYHRTQSELDRKDNARQFAAGGSLSYSCGGMHAGVTALYTSFDKDLQPNTGALFRRNHASGNNFYNVGADYGYTASRLWINGETAVNDRGALATINSIGCRLTDGLDLMALQRFYGMRYYSLFGQSFCDGGAVQNESGVYLGAEWRPSGRMSVTAYTDFAYFAWPRYQSSFSSHSWDNVLSVAYAPGKWSLAARYRYRMRERDNEQKTGLAWKREHRGRVGMTYDNGHWSSKTQADVAYSRFKAGSFGWMISEHVGFSLGDWLKMSGNIGCFSTDDYDSRVYLYERGMTYSFSYPAFYGKGIHYSVMARADVSSGLAVTAKVSVTDYFNRGTIGSGKQLIDRSSQSDLELQLRWKF